MTGVVTMTRKPLPEPYARGTGLWFNNWTRGLVMAALQRGPLPRHIGFILDGNRRWGRQYGLSIDDTYRTGLDICIKV